tara:strand:+ start:1419 stop:2270 length:852 start_codon:yes stop_codon:yes gene_type:complete
MKAASIVLSALVVIGLSTVFITQMPKPESPPVTVVEAIEVIDPLEKARQASFDIWMPLGARAGSAVLVGRVAVEESGYRYRALTANHVISGITDDIGINGENADLDIKVTFRPDFHSPEIQFDVQIEAIDWVNPAGDWASFTFQLEYKLECADIATEAEFKAIKAWDNVYFIGSGSKYGQACRRGVISATDNYGIDREAQSLGGTHTGIPWHQYPENFVKFSAPIWYGDSGGPLFNEHGKLIGLLNAYTIGDSLEHGAVHSGVAFKTHLVRQVVGEDFFKIED